MKQTPNLLLKLPEPTDFVLVEDFNENFTKIDEEIAKITDEETGIEAKLAKHLDEKANKQQEVAQTATLYNGWVGLNDVVYYKDNFGVVHVSGRIHQGVTDNYTLLFNLPEGYRSNVTLYKNSTTYSTAADLEPCLLEVKSNGEVNLAFDSNSIVVIDFSFKVEEVV